MNALVFCNYLFCLGNIYNSHQIHGQRLIISQKKYLLKQENNFNNSLKIAQLSNSNHISLWKINWNESINKIKKRSLGPDQLSKNISSILENLLKSYEKSQLPSHGKGQPTIVRTNILIRSMGPVSEVDMDYSMDCYFRQYWRDKRLSFKGPKSLSLSIKMLDKIWRPDTYFYNGKHSHIHMITVPNKLLRLSHNGDILYSMRLTIKATCPMQLQSFPMDKQSCPLFIGSYSYTKQHLVYQWQNKDAVTYVAGMTLNQFELISMPLRNFTYIRQEGDFSVLHVSFNLKRHTGYFLIQVYIPCTLIVVLSWVSFWIHREATSDRVGLCITTVLTLSTISIDSRKDLPKVKYATALDWFLLMSFFYCIATLLEFAGVHYFTKIGSGEFPITDDDWEDIEFDEFRHGFDLGHIKKSFNCDSKHIKSNLDDDTIHSGSINKDEDVLSTASCQTLTAIENQQIKGRKNMPKWKQMWFCLIGNEKFRREREQIAASQYPSNKVIILNSVSLIDQISRIAFPISFGMFNLIYWLSYVVYYEGIY